MTTHCAGGCGRETTGVRCRWCNGARQAQEWAEALAIPDRELLALREQMSPASIATRMGVSRERIYQKLRDARRREALRAA